jgi:putative aldouronate transport system permease protein
VGFHHFIKLFSTSKFYQVFWNTLVINFYKTLFFFPVPILISLLLNEIHSTGFKRSIQSVLYFPHFLSWVVVAGFVFQFLRPEGPLNSFVATLFGMEPVNFIAKPEYFRPILVVTAMWRETGWATILYMAQLSTIDPQLYEAAYVDGAPRWRQMLHISLPGIMPIVAITLILRLGRTMIIGYEQVLVLYNPMVYDVGDVIQTYIYRTGLLNARFSFAAACGIFQGIVAFILLWASNKLSNRVSGHGIW